MIFLMVSNGLLATLLTLRAGELGFSDTMIGLMQSAYPVGAFAGCVIAPRLVINVGHIRAFAALASLASIAALIHLVTSDIASWTLMRILAGFCYSGLYIVAESWLNGRATNENRASLLSIYFLIQTGGAALGQVFLNLSTPDGIFLFVLVSIFVSLSLIPILTSSSASPPFELPERISIRELFKLTPMGLTGSFLNGISQSALYISLALYGKGIGLAPGEIGGLIGVATLGGMVFQFPIGRLSDRIDRRLVITGVALLSVPISLFIFMLGSQPGNLLWVYAGVFLIGGTAFPIYSVCVAHMNDHLRPSQIVAASGTLTLVLYTGVIIGPSLSAIAIDQLGHTALFMFVAITQALTVTTALFRFWKGKSAPDERGTAMAVAQSATQMAAHLNPEAERPYADDKLYDSAEKQDLRQ
ncbi:MFS transporter [Coralliovum pocilloporae]|uniref:MFS transporter n=1 Tax=Coralliovum pocilloporae TaxID=3066369 RepID=UPI003307BC41